MLTGFETKKVIVGAGNAVMKPQAPVNVVDGDGGAVIVGRAGAACRRYRRGPDRPARSCPEGRRRTDRCCDCRRLSQHHRGLLI